jgi:hypothetical protein
MKTKTKSASRRGGDILPVDSYSLMGDPCRAFTHFTLTITLEPSHGGTKVRWGQVFADASVASAASATRKGAAKMQDVSIRLLSANSAGVVRREAT